MPSRRLLLPSLLCVATLFASCGDDDASKSTSKGGEPDVAATSKKPGKVEAGNVSPENLPEIPTVKNAKGARADVTLKGCPVGERQARATGTVKNSTASTTDYAITISWINKRSDVRARGVVVIKALAAGETRSWKVAAPKRSGIDTCTVFVERGEAR